MPDKVRQQIVAALKGHKPGSPQVQAVLLGFGSMYPGYGAEIQQIVEEWEEEQGR